VVFGVFICLLMGLAMRRHARNERTVDLRGLVEE
jgi:MFS transporter, LPLT family, lysophospholipid transporter